MNTPAFDIKQIPAQTGRIAIVTGANIGLGYETALALAKKDAHVIMACRSQNKAEAAKASILAEAPKVKLDIILLDLGRLQSVREFAKNFLATHDRLDLLINNAGIMMPPHSLTEDGYESQFAVNHLGHFLLTGLLLDRILATADSRIVSLSSIAHRNGVINFDDLQSQENYSASAAYGQSKLACLMFAYELQRRLAKLDTNTISVAAHPGISPTNLAQHMPKIVLLLMPILAPFFTHSPKKGAEPTLYGALGTDVQGGDYFGPGNKREFRGPAAKVDSTPLSKDEEVAKRLWEVSEKLTGLAYLS